MAESITFDFISRGASALSGDFKRTGDSAAAAARGAKVLSEVIEKLGTKEDRTAAESATLAKALRLTGDAEDRAAAKAVAADAAIRRLDDAMKDSSKHAAEAGAGFSGLAGAGGLPGGGMAAAAVAGVALSPVIATLGVGLGGLGLAALSVSKNTKLIGPILAPLKTDFSAFSKALQPEVLTLFGEGATIARHALHDIAPVASATGKALGSVLGQIDAEFQSQRWQQFFGFMAKTAGPDVQLLGNLFTQLAADLPPLLEQLQPLATGLLNDAGAALKLVNAGTQLVAWEHQHAKAVSDNTGLLGRFGHAAEQAFEQLFPGVKAAGALQSALSKAGGTTDATGKKIGGLGASATSAAVHVLSLATQVTGLTNAENKALSPLLAYTGALITQRNDAKNLNDALKTSHDRIGLNTAGQRASFSAANTYIQDLLNTASAATKSHQGIDAQIRSIQGALPQLRNVRGGTRLYWQEVSTLVSWLHRLQAIKRINEAIHVSGTGVWTVTPGKIGLPGGSAGGPFAAGGRITAGTGPTADDVLIRASRNETVVSAAHSKILAPAFRAVGVPGYASGGVVGSWPRLPGLGPWAVRELGATGHAVARSVAAALVAGIKAASAAAVSGALGGPTSASAAQAQSYAASRLGAYGWSTAQMKFLIELWNRESGWNRLARNPSSGAYGIPQALPPGKMGAAANPPTSSAAAQINWGLGYIRGRYGSPQSAWSHELSYNWYDRGGLLKPGLTLAYNGTGRPEQVIPAGRGGGQITVNLSINGPVGSQTELENWLTRSLDNLRRKGRIASRA